MRRHPARHQPTLARLVRLIVACIPHGRLLTYGDVATLCGSPRAARAVGHALRAAGDHPEVPWHRVVNASGAVSLGGDYGRADAQIQRLREEGLTCQDSGRIDGFPTHRWPLNAAWHALVQQGVLDPRGELPAGVDPLP